MAVIYTDKGPGLALAVIAAGYILEEVDNVWTARTFDGAQSTAVDAAVQAVIDTYDEVPDRRVDKIAELNAEGLMRINAVFPAISSIDEIQFFAEFWLSIAPTARAATADFQRAIDIYSTASIAVVTIKSLTTVAAINDYDVVNDPGWPA